MMAQSHGYTLHVFAVSILCWFTMHGRVVWPPKTVEESVEFAELNQHFRKQWLHLGLQQTMLFALATV